MNTEINNIVALQLAKDTTQKVAHNCEMLGGCIKNLLENKEVDTTHGREVV